MPEREQIVITYRQLCVELRPEVQHKAIGMGGTITSLPHISSALTNSQVLRDLDVMVDKILSTF